MSLEQRVRSTLKDAGSRIDTRERKTLQSPTAPTRRERDRFRPVLAVLAGLVGVLLFGAVAILLSDDGAPEVTSSEVLPLDSADVEVLEWTVVDALPDDYVVQAIAEGPNGWLAVAGRFINSAGGDYLTLRSEDGVEWSRVDGASFPAAVHIDQIIGSDAGYTAYGLYAGEDYSVTTTDRPSNFAEPGVWTSVDGTQWELTPLPLPSPEEAISEIVSYGAFHLAIDNGHAIALGVEFDEDLPDVEGTITVPTRPIMWESIQPGEWRLVQPEQLEEWGDLASGPAGIVATGGSESGITIMSWTGETWEETAAVPGNGFQANLVGNEHGYLLQTTSGILFSPDARSWTPVDGPAAGVVVAAHQGGFTVIDRSQETATVWWSQNGSTWTIVGTGDEFGDDLGFIGGAATDKAVVVYGQTRGVDIDDTQGFLLIGTNQP